MSIINKKMQKADYLANEFNNSKSQLERGRIAAEWYVEIGRIAAKIRSEKFETHNTFFKKNLKLK